MDVVFVYILRKNDSATFEDKEKKIYFSSYRKVALFLNSSRGWKATIWHWNGTH